MTWVPFVLHKTDGVIDQDIDGAAAGNWFLEGTNGYAAIFSYAEQSQGKNY